MTSISNETLFFFLMKFYFAAGKFETWSLLLPSSFFSFSLFKFTPSLFFGPSNFLFNNTLSLILPWLTSWLTKSTFSVFPHAKAFPHRVWRFASFGLRLRFHADAFLSLFFFHFFFSAPSALRNSTSRSTVISFINSNHKIIFYYF